MSKINKDSEDKTKSEFLRYRLSSGDNQNTDTNEDSKGHMDKISEENDKYLTKN